MVKGYYLMGSVGLISSSFTLSKVIRDNQEDENNYEDWLPNNQLKKNNITSLGSLSLGFFISTPHDMT